MMVRLLLAAFFVSAFVEPGIMPEPLEWSANRKLTWNDFMASPPENSANAALTSSGILIRFSTNGEIFRYELSCNFDRNNSWGRVKNDYILSHEQGHFDIAELCTRRLNKSLKMYRYRRKSFNKDVNDIYQNTMRELQQTQDQYDRQTDHSRNRVQQKNWLVSITHSLKNLEGFSGYK